MPLRGLRIVELAQNLAGPYAAQILADMGADVVKVERPGEGDPARAWGPPFVGETGGIFAFSNRGKRSIALDLNLPHDRTTFWHLLDRADVLIEALRPGALSRLGFGYEAVASKNPRILYASVLTYGEKGPLRSAPGYDPLMQAHGGIMATTGLAGGSPVRVGTSIVDMATGMWLAISILGAIRERDASGRGAYLTTSLFDSALSWSGYHLLGFLADGTSPEPMGTELGMIAPYGAFPTSDGRLMIAAGNDGLFRRLCSALNLPDYPNRSEFATNPDRVRNRTTLNLHISNATRTRTTDELLAMLFDAGVPASPILSIAQVAKDPQTAASEMLSECDDDSGVPGIALPIRWNGERLPLGRRPPRVGEHTDEVRRQASVGAPAKEPP